jgi:hypothetical protein
MRLLDPEQAREVVRRVLGVVGITFRPQLEGGFRKAVGAITALPGSQVFCEGCEWWVYQGRYARRRCVHESLWGKEEYPPVKCPEGRWSCPGT